MIIIWTDEAKDDMESIYQFVSEKNLKAALSLYNEILDEVDILVNFPYIASIEPILEEETVLMRSLVVASGRYKVIYFVKEIYIYITSVWDCRQDPNILSQQ